MCNHSIELMGYELWVGDFHVSIKLTDLCGGGLKVMPLSYKFVL